MELFIYLYYINAHAQLSATLVDLMQYNIYKGISQKKECNV